MSKITICVGCGLDVTDDGILEVQRRPGGGIECDSTGLFATPVVKSPDECNGFEIRGNGYYSPCPKTVGAVIQNDSVNNDLLPFNSMVNGGEYSFTSGPSSVIGNTLCCAVRGIIAIRAGGLYLDAVNGFYGSARLQVNQGGGGLVDANPDTTMVFENKSGSNVHTSFNNLVDENVIEIPGHSTSSIAAAVVVHVNLGGVGSTLSGFIRFEYVMSLPMNCTCPA